MKIHFIGIGGIGIAGIASFYKDKGFEVQGSDMTESEITKDFKTFIGHKKENVTKDIDLVIHSEAVTGDNVELKEAKRLGIKTSTGAVALAEIQKDYFTIAVSGMHGKTTTSCMVRHILKDLDPSYIIGTKNGGHKGKGKYLIVEADDYKAKFLNYYPDVLLLTNIDEEHMDYFRDLDHILDVFKQYVSQVKTLIIATDGDKNIKEVLKSAKCEVRLVKKKDIELSIPGEHNKMNASLVTELASFLKITASLKDYKGTWRRFEEIKNGDTIIISDYAHHPTELKATFQSLKEKYKGKIWVVFQPHQKQRTFYLFDSFLKVLKEADFTKTIITDIYDVKGRESKEIEVSSKDLAKKANVDYKKRGEIQEYLEKNMKDIDVLCIIGAGDIYNLTKKL